VSFRKSQSDFGTPADANHHNRGITPGGGSGSVGIIDYLPPIGCIAALFGVVSRTPAVDKKHLVASLAEGLAGGQIPA
jgi:hypothetical protein